jgi:hypothetical protein
VSVGDAFAAFLAAFGLAYIAQGFHARIKAERDRKARLEWFRRR